MKRTNYKAREKVALSIALMSSIGCESVIKSSNRLLVGKANSCTTGIFEEDYE